jgi:hypothetical protein
MKKTDDEIYAEYVKADSLPPPLPLAALIAIAAASYLLGFAFSRADPIFMWMMVGVFALFGFASFGLGYRVGKNRKSN